MKKVLILNGHQYYDVVAKGDLTNHYIDCANKFFEENGFEVKHPNKSIVQFLLFTCKKISIFSE